MSCRTSAPLSPCREGFLKGTVFCFLHEAGLEVSPCKSVGYMGSNAPVVEEKNGRRKVEGHIGSNRTIDLFVLCLR